MYHSFTLHAHERRSSLGRFADIVLFERGPNMYPEHSLAANLVYSAGPQNVSDVVIDGRLVMQDRRILTLDEAAITARAEEVSKSIKNR